VGNFLQSRADNYTYLSQIGLSIAVAWSVWSVYQWRQSHRAARWRGWLLGGVSTAVVLLLAAVAWRQTSYWRNDETLWTRAISCTEQNSLAHSCLACEYARQGRTAEAIDQLHEALATDSIARRVTAESHVLLADYLTAQGKPDEAFIHLEQAVAISPSFDLAHDHLAIACARAGQLDRAIAELRETIRLAPAHLQPRINLANVLLAHGEASKAATQCREVLEKDPNAVQAMIVLGAALTAEGQDEEAITHLERATTLEPHNGPAQFSLGLALHERGHSDRALVHLNEAVRLQPDDVRTLWQTAWILATDPDSAIRDGARAVEFATQAVQLSGGRDVHAFDALAAALAETKEFSAAVDAAERASAIALARGDDALMGAIGQRTRQYRQGLPYRPPAPTAPR
jgi:tetratricopeptide (TPR) repeat protein